LLLRPHLATEGLNAFQATAGEAQRHGATIVFTSPDRHIAAGAHRFFPGNSPIEWRVVRRLAAGSVPSTVLTLLVLSHFDIRGTAVRDLITTVLSLALLLTAGLLMFRSTLLAGLLAK
jgi:uncharacterized protein